MPDDNTEALWAEVTALRAIVSALIGLENDRLRNPTKLTVTLRHEAEKYAKRNLLAVDPPVPHDVVAQKVMPRIRDILADAIMSRAP